MTAKELYKQKCKQETISYEMMCICGWLMLAAGITKFIHIWAMLPTPPDDIWTWDATANLVFAVLIGIMAKLRKGLQHMEPELAKHAFSGETND